VATSNFEMGTGKTCTAVGVAEEFIKNKNSSNTKFPSTVLKKIVVLTKGKGLQNNFINEVANVCTKNQYLDGLDRYVKNRYKRIKKNVKVNYTFDTFEIFSKNLKKISNREKALLYENTLFIVDEAHNLRMSADPEENNIYRSISELFDQLKSRKILLLTGTPMKDKPEEILDLLNLIVKEKLTIEDLNNEESFKRKIHGYISYLRAMMSDVDRKEEGQLLGTLTHFKVYPVVMDPFQSKIYELAKQRDGEERSIFNHSRQTSAMVFPDKTYGKSGFEKNIVESSTGYMFANAHVREELQTRLYRYSAKYADLLDKLKDDYDANRLSFVFSEFVKGSGLVALSLLLEINGYIQATANSNFSKPQKRYVIFTNETSTDSQTRNLISVFNNPKNMKGEYISTILGSRVIMEGFSFKNIQSEYILSPHWNYSETSQIIARGLRLGSHNDLIKSGILPKVKIYQYVAISTLGANSSDSSIDLHMYEIAEKKDFQIQKIIRRLKESAFDCELNKERNTITNINLDGTRSCEYTSCEYTCDNPFRVLDPSASNPKNYKLLYFRLSDNYFKLKNFIIQSVITSPITIEEIMVRSKYSEFEIMSVLADLLNFQEVLFTRPEGSYYLLFVKNLFYAGTPTHPTTGKAATHRAVNEEEDPKLLDFYTKFTTIYVGKSIDELIFNHQKNFMVSLVDKIFTSRSLVELQKYMVQLPIYLQEKLLLFSISSSHRDTPNNFVRDMVLNNFRLYYSLKGDNAFVWLNSDRYKCNASRKDYKTWKECNPTEEQQIEKMKKERTKIKIIDNPYGYIGLLNRTSNDFCLRKVEDGDGLPSQQDKRKRNVGKRCQNWKKKELIDLVSNRLKVNPDEDFGFDETDVAKMRNDPKFTNLLETGGSLKDYKRVAFWNAQDVNYLCTKIMQNFMDKKLVVDDPNCGTSKKVR
jgi:superfamily II DNA or RNA helicase